MNILSVIETRRDGQRHSAEELQFLCQGAANKSIPDYQLSAWLMAAYLHPLSDDETALLTLAMAESGDRLDLTGLPKPWLDKHSTGGVGDKASLILLPLLAACGVTMVKMSGRALGMTGGTIDKLSSIPGFRTDLTPKEMVDQARQIGVAITGQTLNLAPADKVLYALRDVTGTVGSIPLIVSSILSKKIAGGARTIVLDVKSGSGGFMQTEAGARLLANALARTARACSLVCHIAITDMSQPLGAVGNSVEVRQAIHVLSNREPDLGTRRVRDLCLELAGESLVATSICGSQQDGLKLAQEVLESGAAFDKARAWFRAQGGDIDADLPIALVERTVCADRSGWIEGIDARTIGMAAGILAHPNGWSKGDPLDLTTGIEIHLPVGSTFEQGAPLFTIYAGSEIQADTIGDQIEGAYRFSSQPTPAPDLVLEFL